jgi:hypothetical protein
MYCNVDHVSFYRTHGNNPRAQQGQTLEVAGPDGKPVCITNSYALINH